MTIKKITNSKKEVKSIIAIVDKRNLGKIIPGEFFIDYLFLKENFDIYTQNIYTNMLSDSAKSKNRTIIDMADSIGISLEQTINSLELLSFCNIINMLSKISPYEYPKIVLVDKSKWQLNHEWRDAKKFFMQEKRA